MTRSATPSPTGTRELLRCKSSFEEGEAGLLLLLFTLCRLPAAEDAEQNRAEHGVPVRRERPAGEEDGERRGDHLLAGYRRQDRADAEGQRRPAVPVRGGRPPGWLPAERRGVLLCLQRAGRCGRAD